MRIAFAVILWLIVAYLLLTAVGSLANLNADYKDSTDATYVTIGVGALVLASIVALVAFGVLTDWRGSIWLPLAAAAVAAAGVPYASLLGPAAGWPLHAAIGAVAAVSIVRLARHSRRGKLDRAA